MTVLLQRSGHVPATGWTYWVAIMAESDLDPARRMADLPQMLEQAFDNGIEDLLALGRALGAEPSAAVAHAPACASNVSDLGTVLAWDRLVRQWAAESPQILVVCDDPWLFRHWAAVTGVRAGSPPALLKRYLCLGLRGLAARLAVSLRMVRAARALRHHTKAVKLGAPALMVYGHPQSNASGGDAYFGGLMSEIAGLTRILHVDCPPARAADLFDGGRTLSLHGFGSVTAAIGLWRAVWRPRVTGPYAQLIRRAAALEGGTGTPAMIAWQLHCQQRWLAAAKPKAVAWPWENHSWERVFVRQARSLGVTTVGYQHATVGRRETNYNPRSNSDGEASLPDRLLCVGAADRARLEGWGCPAARLGIGGALRFPQGKSPVFDAQAPLFLALPFDGVIAAEMVAAIRPVAAAGRRVLVKDHPMSPFAFEPSAGLERCVIPLSEQSAISAVVYCITSVGLEALLAGLPTIRFMPQSRPVVDIMPNGVVVPVATAANLGEMLDKATPPDRVSRDWVFAAPDVPMWRQVLA